MTPSRHPKQLGVVQRARLAEITRVKSLTPAAPACGTQQMTRDEMLLSLQVVREPWGDSFTWNSQSKYLYTAPL